MTSSCQQMSGCSRVTNPIIRVKKGWEWSHRPTLLWARSVFLFLVGLPGYGVQGEQQTLWQASLDSTAFRMATSAARRTWPRNIALSILDVLSTFEKL